MKWFQHFTDSYSNLKIQKLRKVFGLEGVGFWWLCSELVGQQGENYIVEKDKDWLSWLEIQSGMPLEKIKAMLEKMAEFTLIDPKEYTKGNLAILQMAEYSDDYTNKVRRLSEHSPDSVRQDKIRIDKNTHDIPSFKRILGYYYKKVESDKGFKPEIGKADCSLLKSRLKKFGEKEIEDLIDFYMKSEKAERCGISLRVVLSNDSINQWQQKAHKTKFL